MTERRAVLLTTVGMIVFNLSVEISIFAGCLTMFPVSWAMVVAMSQCLVIIVATVRHADAVARGLARWGES